MQLLPLRTKVYVDHAGLSQPSVLPKVSMLSQLANLNLSQNNNLLIVIDRQMATKVVKVVRWIWPSLISKPTKLNLRRITHIKELTTNAHSSHLREYSA